MAFADNLVHRLELLRRRSDSDRMGQPRERWDSIARDVACRATTVRGRETATERMRETYNVTHRVFLVHGSCDANEDDEISVTDQDGRDVLPRARIVLKRIAYGSGQDPHHLELDCESLRGPM